MRRDRNDPCSRPDKFVEVFGKATHDISAVICSQQRLLNEAYTGGHVLRGTVFVTFDLTPFGVLAVQDSLEPDGQRGHRHLNKITRMVDRLGERRSEND